MKIYFFAFVAFLSIGSNALSAVWVDDLSGRYVVQEKTTDCFYSANTFDGTKVVPGLVDISEDERGVDVSNPVATQYAQSGWGESPALDRMEVGTSFDSGFDGVGSNYVGHFTAHGFTYVEKDTDSGQAGYLHETDIDLEADANKNVLMTITKMFNSPAQTSVCHLTRVN